MNIKGKKIALVLGGGGALAAFEVGVIRWMKENNAHIVGCYGTSAGALNSALLSQDNYEGLEALWGSFSENNSFFKQWPLGIFQSYWKRAALNPAPLYKLIEKYTDPSKILKSGIRFGAIMTNMSLGTKESYILSKENLPEFKRVLEASSAVQSIFPPVQIKDYLYGDGGLTENVPLELAKNDVSNSKANSFVVVSCSKVLDPILPANANYFRYLIRTIDILLNDRERSGLDKLDSDTILIEPGKESGFFSILDTRQESIQKLINLGYDRAKTLFQSS
ncbi:phospholipase, patatin family [Leptospira broomii serovar Hurstbridge str. 5399]|uniref:Phospholipase, patatin family n=1 Tax=Leptospira broomii serovar Hurstbridge str. 5399 TaxID=1049789 RepID=T0F790_9LEPT|nr:patatin-like phospholipase family protein [Leptospira broomii]EQA43382.1 phospholipase, patatin family [Leptospira broomii serovar Hurstbridge str. 5399]